MDVDMDMWKVTNRTGTGHVHGNVLKTYLSCLRHLKNKLFFTVQYRQSIKVQLGIEFNGQVFRPQFQ